MGSRLRFVFFDQRMVTAFIDRDLKIQVFFQFQYVFRDFLEGLISGDSAK